MERITARTADRAALRDIRDVKIDTSKPCKQRIKEYIDQIGNPYCYRDGDIVVEIEYADTNVSLHDRLVAYASSLGQCDGNISQIMGNR